MLPNNLNNVLIAFFVSLLATRFSNTKLNTCSQLVALIVIFPFGYPSGSKLRFPTAFNLKLPHSSSVLIRPADTPIKRKSACWS